MPPSEVVTKVPEMRPKMKDRPKMTQVSNLRYDTLDLIERMNTDVYTIWLWSKPAIP